MLNRREALKRAGLIGVGALVALRTGGARAQGGRKPALTIALPSGSGNDRSAPVPLRPHRSILVDICETLLIRRSQEHGAQAAAGPRRGATSIRTRRSSTAARGEVPRRRAVRRRVGQVHIDRTSAPSSTRSARCCGRRPRPGGAVVDPGTVRITTKVPTRFLPDRRGGGVGDMAPPKGHGRVREKFVSDRRSAPGRSVRGVRGRRARRARGESRTTGAPRRRASASCGRSCPTRPRAWPRWRAARSTSC